jgi:hypothetical protein
MPLPLISRISADFLVRLAEFAAEVWVRTIVKQQVCSIAIKEFTAKKVFKHKGYEG